MVIAGCKVSAEMHNPYIVGRLGHQPYDPAPDPAIFERPLPKFDSVYDDLRDQNADRKPALPGAVKGRKRCNRRVRDVATGEIFDSAAEVAQRHHVTVDQVYACCYYRLNGRDATCGRRGVASTLRFEWAD